MKPSNEFIFAEASFYKNRILIPKINKFEAFCLLFLKYSGLLLILVLIFGGGGLAGFYFIKSIQSSWQVKQSQIDIQNSILLGEKSKQAKIRQQLLNANFRLSGVNILYEIFKPIPSKFNDIQLKSFDLNSTISREFGYNINFEWLTDSQETINDLTNLTEDIVLSFRPDFSNSPFPAWTYRATTEQGVNSGFISDRFPVLLKISASILIDSNQLLAASNNITTDEVMRSLEIFWKEKNEH